MTVEARQALAALYYGTSEPDECGCIWIDTNFTPNRIKLQTDTNPATFVTLGVVLHDEIKGSDVASANNLAPAVDGGTFHVTGNTQINLIATDRYTSGGRITMIFDSNPTVKHNQAASGANKPILLSGAADFAATSSDTLTLYYDGSNWYELARTVI